jgi:hypothetical protein
VSRPRLTGGQRYTLERLAHLRAQLHAGERSHSWGGALEGVGMGSTLAALERRGYVETRVVRRPHVRMVGRITPAGLERLAQDGRREPPSTPEGMRPLAD